MDLLSLLSVIFAIMFPDVCVLCFCGAINPNNRNNRKNYFDILVLNICGAKDTMFRM